MVNKETKESRTNRLNYKKAGVDIGAGNQLIKNIGPLIKKTSRPGASGTIGGFGGLFDLKQAGFDDPILVSGSDGVGTKLVVAATMGEYERIGIDLVAMCTNDVVVPGAEPLFFLDYYATGKLIIDSSVSLINGIVQGCCDAGCALIGGETAEMPGIYGVDKYELAGFCVGAVERTAILSGENIIEGDIILGLASNGIHANGFSLIRHIFSETRDSYSSPAPFEPDRRIGDVLLDPTRIYVKSCLSAIKTGHIKALAHITGGGIIENLPRVVPNGNSVVIDCSSWKIPEIFHWLKNKGDIEPIEMFRVFNCGIGMAVICTPNNVAELTNCFQNAGEQVFEIGYIKSNPGFTDTILNNCDEPWQQK